MVMYRLTLCKQAGDVILRLQRLFPWNEKSKMSKEMNMKWQRVKFIICEISTWFQFYFNQTAQ